MRYSINSDTIPLSFVFSYHPLQDLSVSIVKKEWKGTGKVRGKQHNPITQSKKHGQE